MAYMITVMLFPGRPVTREDPVRVHPVYQKKMPVPLGPLGEGWFESPLRFQLIPGDKYHEQANDKEDCSRSRI